MTDNKTAWWETMIKKHGSEEAVRAFMRQAQEKSMQNPNKQRGIYKGPFNRMSKEQLREVSRKGGHVSTQKQSRDANGRFVKIRAEI